MNGKKLMFLLLTDLSNKPRNGYDDNVTANNILHHYKP